MTPQRNHTTYRATSSLGSRGSRFMFVFLLAASLIAGGLLRSKRTADNRAPAASVEPAEIERKASESYGSLSLSFEENRGQAARPFDFLARGAGYTIALSPVEAVFALRNSDCGLRNEEGAALNNPNPNSAIRNRRCCACDSPGPNARRRPRVWTRWKARSTTSSATTRRNGGRTSGPSAACATRESTRA